MPKISQAIVFCCDENLYWQVAYLINRIEQIEKSHNFDIHLYILNALSDQQKKALPKGVFIHQVNFEIDFPKETLLNHITQATFIRLFAVDELAVEYDRVLYLDVDIFIERSSLEELFSQDLKGKPLGAVRDILYWPGNYRPRLARRMLRGHGLAGRAIFNAGVLLFDGAKVEKGKYLAKARDTLRDHPQLCPYGDQSALNIVFDESWTELSPIWNWQNVGHAAALTRTFQPKIVHFIGKFKPWQDPHHLIERYFISDMIFFLMEHNPELGSSLIEDLQSTPNKSKKHIRVHTSSWEGVEETLDLWKNYIDGFSEEQSGN